MAKQAIFGLAAPAALAAAVIAPAAPRPRLAWLLPVALAAPVVMAFLGLGGWPREDWQRTMFVPAVGALIGVLVATAQRTRAVRSLLCIALGFLTTLAIWPVVAREALWVQAIGPAATIVLAAMLEPLAARRSGPDVPGGLALVAAAAGAVVLISGFAKLAVPVIALAVALAVCGAISFWRPSLSVADGAIAVVAPMIALAPLVAWLYNADSGSPIPAVSFALPALAALALWTGELPMLRGRAPWMARALRWLLVAAIGAAALAVALRPAGQAAGDDSYEDLYRQMMPR